MKIERKRSFWTSERAPALVHLSAVEAEDDAEPMSSDWFSAAGNSAWEQQITLVFGDVQPECVVEGRAQVLLS